MATVFEDLAAGATVYEVAEWFDVPVELIRQVVDFTARSLGQRAIDPSREPADA